MGLDPVGPLLALVAAPVALVAIPRLAPAAVGFLTVAAVVVRPGYVPPSLVVLLLPLGALLAGGHAAHAWSWPGGGRVLAGIGLVVATIAVVAWSGDARALLTAGDDGPLRAATRWIAETVPADERVIVDDAISVDLLEAGADPGQVTGYAALDTAPRQDHDLVMVTETLCAFPAGHPQAAAAVRHSTVVATFGSGPTRVDIRRITRPVRVSGWSDDHRRRQ